MILTDSKYYSLTKEYRYLLIIWKQIQFKMTTLTKSKRAIIAEINKALTKSEELKKDSNKETFDLAMNDILVGLKGYINVWLLGVVNNHKIHAG